MDFATCLQQQLQRHPAMQPRDVLKLCYQAARGAEHLLADAGRARTYFDQEYAATPADSSLPLFESISPDIARVNLAAWKTTALPADWLFRMFLHTAQIDRAGNDLLDAYLRTAGELVARHASFPLNAWQEALSAWDAAGRPAIHHSSLYRDREHPAYRIVNGRFQCILPMLERLAAEAGIRIVAIDGRAASGKTTRSALLSAVLAAPVIHMDDFFLPPSLRTPERLAQPGGNVHYERFAEEVLPGLLSGEAFSYRIFDCGQMDYNGRRDILAAPVRIVEGSYALHPAFGDYAQLRVFTSVDADEQMRRILVRNGEQMAEMFRTRWIPLEEKYFAAFAIADRAELRLG